MNDGYLLFHIYALYKNMPEDCRALLVNYRPIALKKYATGEPLTVDDVPEFFYSGETISPLEFARIIYSAQDKLQMTMVVSLDFFDNISSPYIELSECIERLCKYGRPINVSAI